MEKHRPSNYVSGVYVYHKDSWLGDFEASQEELLHYAEHDVTTVAEFDCVMTMAIAQYEYERWWFTTLANHRNDKK